MAFWIFVIWVRLLERHLELSVVLEEELELGD